MSEEITKDLKRIVPKRWKRYPRCKDSGVEWIGEIPEGWETVRLKHLTKKIGSGITPRGGAENYLVWGIPLIRSQNVQFEGLSLEGLAHISDEQNKKMINSKALPNDVLLNITGASIGRTCMVPQNMEQSNVNQHVCIIRPRRSSLSQFMWRFLSSEAGQIQVFEGEDGISREGLNFERIKNFVITLPPDDDRKRITAYLDSNLTAIVSLISKKQRLIELLKEKRAAIITQAVTKGLDHNAPMKDSGVEWIGEIPTNWRIFRLKDLARINPSKTEINHLADDLEVSFVPMGSIGEYGGISGAEVKRLLDVKQGYTYFAEGDLIVAKITPCFENYKGAIASNLVNGIGFGTTELFVLRPNERVDLRYLFYVSISKAFRQTGSNMMQGAAGQKRITADFVNNYPVALPRPEEQRSIASSLEKATEKMDSFISKIEKSIELLKEYRSALITAAVTGKIDVREEVP